MNISLEGLLLGIDAPVKGGDLRKVDSYKLHVSSQKLVERAGHTRVAIGAAYYGSRRISKKKEDISQEKEGIIPEDIPI